MNEIIIGAISAVAGAIAGVVGYLKFLGRQETKFVQLLLDRLRDREDRLDRMMEERIGWTESQADVKRLAETVDQLREDLNEAVGE